MPESAEEQSGVYFILSSIQDLVSGLGLPSPWESVVAYCLLFCAVIAVAFLCGKLAHSLFLRVIKKIVIRTENNWDDAFMKSGVFVRAMSLVPAIVVYVSAPLFPALTEWIERLAHVWLLIGALSIVYGALDASDMIYRKYELAKRKPIKGYLDMARIVVTVIVGIVAIGAILNKNPWTILTGLGAMTAILMLVFKDSILGFVAGLQLSANDMVRVGDWIEMPAFGTDGDVIEISLHTVKVQNWDKTISTIPTHALISNSFRNWRGMSDSGGRRIKRALNIDMSSIRFCSEEELDRFERIDCLRDYVTSRRTEVAAFNQEREVDLAEVANGRRLTNIGTFRKYVESYLRTIPDIHPEMTFLVRQLAPAETGLPIEIYVFSSDQAWVSFESIQSDIFDHLIAVLPEFGLKVFQSPSGADIREISSTKSD